VAIEVNTSTSLAGPDVENDEQVRDSRGQVIEHSYVNSGQVGAVESGGPAVLATARARSQWGTGP